MFSRAALATVSTACGKVKVAVGISKGCSCAHYVKRAYSNILSIITQSTGQSAASSSKFLKFLSAEQVHEVHLLSASGREAVILGICKECFCRFFKSICLSINIIIIGAFIGIFNLGAGSLNLIHHVFDTVIFKAAVGRNIYLATGKSNVGSIVRILCCLATSYSYSCSIIQLTVKHRRIDKRIVVNSLVIVIALAGNLHLSIFNTTLGSDIKSIFGFEFNTLTDFYISSIAFHRNAHADASFHEISQLIPRLRLRRFRRCRRRVKLILQLLRRVLGVGQPVFDTAQSFILDSALTNKRIYCLAAFDVGNNLLHKCRRTHSVVGNDSIIRQNIFRINRQASILAAYVTIDVDICLAVIISYVDSSSNNSLFTCAYLCLGKYTVYRFRFNINVLLQLSHLRSLANGNTALVVTRSDIQRYITQIGVFRNIHSGGLGFTVHLAVGQGSNGRAARGFKGAVNIYCCLIMCLAVGYGSRRDDVGACHVHNLQQSSAGASAGLTTLPSLTVSLPVALISALWPTLTSALLFKTA